MSFSLHLYKIVQVFLSLKMKGGMLMIKLTKEDILYFYYDEMTKDVITSEESISFEKGIELEL